MLHGGPSFDNLYQKISCWAHCKHINLLYLHCYRHNTNMQTTQIKTCRILNKIIHIFWELILVMIKRKIFLYWCNGYEKEEGVKIFILFPRFKEEGKLLENPWPINLHVLDTSSRFLAVSYEPKLFSRLTSEQGKNNKSKILTAYSDNLVHHVPSSRFSTAFY